MKGIDYKTMFGFSGVYQIKNILNGKTYIGSGKITTYKQQHNWKTIHVYDITTLSLVGSYKNMKEVSKILSYTGKPSYTQFLSTLKKDKNTNKYKYLCSLEMLSKEELIDKIKEKLPNRKYKELSNLPF